MHQQGQPGSLPPSAGMGPAAAPRPHRVCSPLHEVECSAAQAASACPAVHPRRPQWGPASRECAESVRTTTERHSLQTTPARSQCTCLPQAGAEPGLEEECPTPSPSPHAFRKSA